MRTSQRHLPGPFPFLELLFPGNGRLSGFVWFKIDEHLNAVFPGESFNYTMFVMPYPLHKIGCCTYAERTVSFPLPDSSLRGQAFAGITFRGSIGLYVRCYSGTRLPEDPKFRQCH